MALQPVTPQRAAWWAGASSWSAPRGFRATGLSARGNGSWVGEGLTRGRRPGGLGTSALELLAEGVRCLGKQPSAAQDPRAQGGVSALPWYRRVRAGQAGTFWQGSGGPWSPVGSVQLAKDAGIGTLRKRSPVSLPPREHLPLGDHPRGSLCATPLRVSVLAREPSSAPPRVPHLILSTPPFGFLSPIWLASPGCRGDGCSLGCRAKSLCLLGPGAASPRWGAGELQSGFMIRAPGSPGQAAQGRGLWAGGSWGS